MLRHDFRGNFEWSAKKKTRFLCPKITWIQKQKKIQFHKIKYESFISVSNLNKQFNASIKYVTKVR